MSHGVGCHVQFIAEMEITEAESEVTVSAHVWKLQDF